MWSNVRIGGRAHKPARTEVFFLFPSRCHPELLLKERPLLFIELRIHKTKTGVNERTLYISSHYVNKDAEAR